MNAFLAQFRARAAVAFWGASWGDRRCHFMAAAVILCFPSRFTMYFRVRGAAPHTTDSAAAETSGRDGRQREGAREGADAEGQQLQMHRHLGRTCCIPLSQPGNYEDEGGHRRAQVASRLHNDALPSRGLAAPRCVIWWWKEGNLRGAWLPLTPLQGRTASADATAAFGTFDAASGRTGPGTGPRTNSAAPYQGAKCAAQAANLRILHGMLHT